MNHVTPGKENKITVSNDVFHNNSDDSLFVFYCLKIRKHNFWSNCYRNVKLFKTDVCGLFVYLHCIQISTFIMRLSKRD